MFQASKKHWAIEHFETINKDLVDGEYVEENVYKQLKEVITVPDIVVVHGCSLYSNILKNQNKEVDFLLLSADRKIVINIECKRSWTTKAIDQVMGFKDLLENCVWDVLDTSWTYIPVVYFDMPLGLTIPPQFQHQVLTRTSTDWQTWYHALLAKYPPTHNSTTADGQLKTFLQPFIFCVHTTRPIVKTLMFDEIKKNIDKATTVQNISFYSGDQLQLMSADDEYNHVIFHCQYGTGMLILINSFTYLCLTR